jgi:hypothetical protein
MATPNQTLTTYASDMHALVTHGLAAVGRQLENLKDKSLRHPEAYSTLEEIQRTLQAQATMLDARVTGLGGSTAQPVKDAVSAVAGYVAGLINAVREEEASKSIRDDYTFLAHTSIGYLMLHATAAALSDPETAALADACYRDAARLAMHIDRIMPTLVLQELREDGLATVDAAQGTRTMVRKAWDREAPAAGFAG